MSILDDFVDKLDFLKKIPDFVKWTEFSEDKVARRSLKYFNIFLSKNLGRILRECQEYGSTSYGRYDGYDGVIDRIRSISYNLDEQYGPKIESGIPTGYPSKKAYREALIWLRNYCRESQQFAGKISVSRNVNDESVPGNVSHLLNLSDEIQHVAKECIAILDFPKKVIVLAALVLAGIKFFK